MAPAAQDFIRHVEHQTGVRLPELRRFYNSAIRGGGDKTCTVTDEDGAKHVYYRCKTGGRWAMGKQRCEHRKVAARKAAGKKKRKRRTQQKTNYWDVPSGAPKAVRTKFQQQGIHDPTADTRDPMPSLLDDEMDEDQQLASAGIAALRQELQDMGYDDAELREASKDMMRSGVRAEQSVGKSLSRLLMAEKLAP